MVFAFAAAAEDEGRLTRVFPVKAARVVPQDFTVTLESRGTVRPRTQSSLIPEVAGMVIEISPSLREGDFFEAGEVLLRIDPRITRRRL